MIEFENFLLPFWLGRFLGILCVRRTGLGKLSFPSLRRDAVELSAY